MNPERTVLLLSPGKENVQSGPDPSWLEKLEYNLDLLLRRHTGWPLTSIVPEGKKASDALSGPYTLVLLMHESYAIAGKFMKLLESISDTVGTGENTLVRIDTSPDPVRDLPPGIASAVSVELYESADGKGEFHWLTEDSGAYWSRLLDVASEIKRMESQRMDITVSSTKSTVYLAQTAADMRMNRHGLRRELQEYGFSVLPGSDLRGEGGNLKSHVMELASRCKLFIHLLGNSYGDLMKETGHSLPEDQVQFITEYLAEGGSEPSAAGSPSSRLIWIDPDFNPADTNQEEFINRLRRNIENLPGTEIIQSPIELFKALVIKRLNEKLSTVSVSGDTDGKGLLYIIHTASDQEAAARFSGMFKEASIRSVMLDYSGEQHKLFADHKQYLRECDGALVYYGRENRSWLRSKIMDLLKAPGMGRKKPLKVRQVLAHGKDLLEDYTLPASISISRETEFKNVADQITKNLT